MGVLYTWTTTVNGNPYAYMGPGSVTVLRTPTWLGRLLSRRESRAKLKYNDTADRWYFANSGDQASCLLGWKLDRMVFRHRKRVRAALLRAEAAEDQEAKIPNWDDI